MQYFVLTLAYLLLVLNFCAQNKAPFIFRLQNKIVTKKMHKYVRHDTIIETSKAKIHIHYSQNSNKPYLLLLHGMGGNARLNWHMQVAYLSKYYNLLLPDLVYFGESTAKENNYSVEFQVEQIREAIKILKIYDKINVMGFSYGGLTSALYNQLYPNEINKLIFVDAPVKFYSSKIADSLAHIVGAPSMTNVIVPQNIHEFKVMEKAVLSKKTMTTRRIKKQFMALYLIPNIQTRQHQMSYINEYQTKYQKYDYNLEKTPTLLLWGAKDGVVPLSVGENLKTYFPSTTKLIVYPKARHDTHFKYSKKLNKAVVNFLMN